jgi:hypothetical protein
MPGIGGDGEGGLGRRRPPPCSARQCRRQGTDLETFFAEAPQLNPSRALIIGVICGVRVEDIEEPTMQEIRYLDKLIDELTKGKAMEKVLRK